jgi:toxin FitB
MEAKDPDFAREIWYGAILAEGRFYRILPVDREIAELAAIFRADFNTPYYDSLIAATAKIHKLTLATRNTADFVTCGI